MPTQHRGHQLLQHALVILVNIETRNEYFYFSRFFCLGQAILPAGPSRTKQLEQQIVNSILFGITQLLNNDICPAKLQRRLSHKAPYTGRNLQDAILFPDSDRSSYSIIINHFTLAPLTCRKEY